MARIYKGSTYHLQLLISKFTQPPVEDVKISFYTTRPSDTITVSEGIVITGNIADVEIKSTQFNALDEGLLNYIVTGTREGITFIEERQSNYYLRNNSTMEGEDVPPQIIVITENGEHDVVLDAGVKKVNITVDVSIPSIQDVKNVTLTDNKEYVVTKDEGFDAVEKVNITVDVPLPKLEEEITVKLNAGETGVIDPSEGYDAMKKVNYTIPINPALLDLSVIGYTEVLPQMASAIAYSQSLYENWNSGISQIKDGNLVYMPLVDTSNRTTFDSFFKNCYRLYYVPSIDTSKATKMDYMFADCSSLPTVSLFDTSSVTSMIYMFYKCENLTTLPLFDTSKVTEMTYMFYGCSSLKVAPKLDTSSVNTMYYMFGNCKLLENIDNMKNWDTSKVKSMERMFISCWDLTDFDVNWDTSNVTNMMRMFNDCTGLTYIGAINCSSVEVNNYPIYSTTNFNSLTDIGGFIGMKASWTSLYGLAKCPNLTYQSCINILNGLYDFKGQTPGSSEGQLKVHANFLSLVGDEISIGTNKGWTITT